MAIKQIWFSKTLNVSRWFSREADVQGWFNRKYASWVTPPFVVGTTASATATGIDIGQSGDYLVAEVVSDTTTLTAPSGWTLITGSTTTWGGGGLKYSAWQIKRGVSAPALTWSAINVFSVVITAVRHPLAYAPTFNALANSALAATTASSPTLTTTTSNAIVLLGLALSASAMITPPSGYNVTLNDGTNGLAAVNKLQTVAGATGVNTWTLSVSDNSVSSTITIDYAIVVGGNVFYPAFFLSMLD